MNIQSPIAQALETLTGIQGFDAITDGRLPRVRTTPVRGGPACGQAGPGMRIDNGLVD